MSITKYKVSLDPAVLDRLRQHSPRRLDSRHVFKWQRFFADHEGLESARLGELTHDLKLIELIPVAEMTGAKELILYANPGSRCEADAEEVYRIEDVALTLVRLYWAGVKLPAMIFAGSLGTRLKRKKLLTENELRVLWASSGKPVLPQRITIHWRAGDHTKHFEVPTAKRLPDSRLSIQFLNPALEGVELVTTAISAKTRQELAGLGCGLGRLQLNTLIANGNPTTL